MQADTMLLCMGLFSRFLLRGECLRQINPLGKISLSLSGKSLLGIRHPVLEEGALAIVTERSDGSCGGRGGIVRAMGSQGGIDSVSGHRTCRRAVLNRTAKPCGPDASMVGVKSFGGAKAQPGRSAGFREATEARRARYSGVSAI
jgi:hypothetical protein